MKTSEKDQVSYGSRRLYIENQDSDYDSSLEFSEQYYCTLESSSRTNEFPRHNNPRSALDFSHSDLIMMNGSPENESCLTHDLRHKIRELETAMLGSDADVGGLYDAVHHVVPAEANLALSEAEQWKRTTEEVVSRGDLKEMLFTCARAMEEKDMETTEWLMSELRKLVSISGTPVQRIGAYMVECLVARMARSGSGIYKALKCKEPSGDELVSYMQLLFEICPYFKFGYLSANGAIAEAMKEENRVHIIDFQINQGSQWISLIQALAGRPGGPPRVRISGVDDSASNFARGGGLDMVGKRLSRLAQSCHVPFEFHAVGVAASDVQLKDLELRQGEAVAVNFAMMLHHMPDATVDRRHNPRDRLVRLAKQLKPKVVALVEQECDSNDVPFLPRFMETMNYYLPVFESIDVVLPREHKERINVEMHCLARELVNVVACEGAERVERHELLCKWRSRFAMAGFTPYPLSSFVNSTIKNLLDNYCGNYTLDDRDGALYLGWMNRALVASCAWR